MTDTMPEWPHDLVDTQSTGRRKRPGVYEVSASSCFEPGSNFQSKRWRSGQALKESWERKNILEEAHMSCLARGRVYIW